MTRPTNSEFIDSTVTEGGFKVALSQLNDWLGLMAGSEDGYLKIARGTNATRPAATAEDAWIRLNTDSGEVEITEGSIWKKIITGITGVFGIHIKESARYIALFESIDAGDISTIEVRNNSGDYIDVERTATSTIIRSSGLDKIYFQINGVNVMSIDDTGNMICSGNITANGVP